MGGSLHIMVCHVNLLINFELEADQFAAGLLMPAALFRRAFGKYEPGLASAEGLADLCSTSLLRQLSDMPNRAKKLSLS